MPSRTGSSMAAGSRLDGIESAVTVACKELVGVSAGVSVVGFRGVTLSSSEVTFKTGTQAFDMCGTVAHERFVHQVSTMWDFRHI